MAMIEHNEITLEKRNQSKVVRSFALPKRTATQPEKSHNNYMIIANGIFYNGQSADKVYLGENLVWEKQTTPIEPHTISGVWADSPNPIYPQYNGKPYINYNGTRIDNLPINADKTFYYDTDEVLTTASYLFSDYVKEGNSSTIDFNYNLTKVDLSNLDFSKVKYFISGFKNCVKLTEITGLNNLDTSSLESCEDCFYGCTNLEEIDISNWNTNNIQKCANMFNECKNIKRIVFPKGRMIDTTNGGGSIGMFKECINLVTVINFNFTSSKQANYQDFYGCQKLENVIGSPSFNNTVNLKSCPLTNASAMVFINGLAEVTEAKNITFKASTYDTLTPEQIAVATSKGWNVVRYTY